MGCCCSLWFHLTFFFFSSLSLSLSLSSATTRTGITRAAEGVTEGAFSSSTHQLFSSNRQDKRNRHHTQPTVKQPLNNRHATVTKRKQPSRDVPTALLQEKEEAEEHAERFRDDSNLKLNNIKKRINILNVGIEVRSDAQCFATQKTTT